MSHFSDALHLDPCRVCGVIDKRSAMIEAKRIPRNSPKARGYYCEKDARIRGYEGPPPRDESLDTKRIV